MRKIYILEKLVNSNDNNHVSVDESLFAYTNGVQNWVVVY